jgi:hypothetical protein
VVQEKAVVAPSEPAPPPKTDVAGAPVPSPVPSTPSGETTKRVKAPAPAVVEQGTGLISVGGEALLRGEVFVDGKSVGFAPGRFEVNAGAHRLEVVTPDGQKHVREVTVTRLNTPSAPLTWVE